MRRDTIKFYCLHCGRSLGEGSKNKLAFFCFRILIVPTLFLLFFSPSCTRNGGKRILIKFYNVYFTASADTRRKNKKLPPLRHSQPFRRSIPKLNTKLLHLMSLIKTFPGVSHHLRWDGILLYNVLLFLCLQI